jgi:hypothetical protein
MAKDAESYRHYCVILTGILCTWFEAIVFDDECLVIGGGLVMPALCQYKTVRLAFQVLDSSFLGLSEFQAICKFRVFLQGMSIRRLSRCVFCSAKAYTGSFHPTLLNPKIISIIRRTETTVHQ